MRNLIPHFIQEKYLQNQSQGRFEAYTLYIDLHGFTPLTETLMKQGTDGAEELSLILNSIFGSMVSMVYQHNGFIPYFAGDAITAIFPKETANVSALDLLQAAQLLEKHFTEEGLKKTRFGDFQIGIKTRLSFGEVGWGLVGRKLKTFYFRGPAISNPTQAHEIAQEPGILFDQHLFEQIPPEEVPALELVQKKYYRLPDDFDGGTSNITLQQLPALKKAVLSKFLPNSILEFNQEGEFREVLSLFITFIGIDNHILFDEFATIVLDLVDKFSGYFKEIDFGDKGGMMVVFFGAPVSYENNSERALEFISALQEETQSLQASSKLQFRAGISSGLAYTGIIGGDERCQYAAVGNRVNLAARLMTQAKWNFVRVDEAVASTRNFRFTPIGDTQYKGIEGSIPTYELEGRGQEDQTVFSGKMVGRNRELKELIAFATPIFDNRFAGVACLYGEAGIGKSRLAFEIKKALLALGKLHWFNCPADQILQKPFNPFVTFLKDYFQQTPDNTAEANLLHFERQYKSLLLQLQQLQQPEASLIHKELQRTQSILAALIGIPYSNSLWSQLDAKGRYQNTLAALSALFIGESLLQPVVIELEDGHWVDNSSKEFLKKFANRIRQYPIFLLITSRYLDDGSKPQIIESEVIERNHISQIELDLNIFSPESLKTFTEIHLEGKVSDELLSLLQRTTNGNPFYLEQVLQYFSESQLLKFENGEWHIIDANIKVSGSISAVLMARIDRLSTLVKETVKAAAVIGREFDVPILSEIMKSHKEFTKYNGNNATVLREQIDSAETVQIWLAMNELRYIFRHSLLREAVYSMQMGARLRELHGLTAEAIERLYADKLEEKYVDLAFHFEQAQQEDKTCEYLEKAASYASQGFQNDQALNFYDKLLPRITDKRKQVSIILQKAGVLELIGKWGACEKSLQIALQLAIVVKDKVFIGRTNNRIGRLNMLRGNYEQAQKHFETAKELFEAVTDDIGMAKVYGNLGNLYFRQGNYQEANDFFFKSLHLSRSQSLATSHANIVSHLGLAYMNLGQFEEGIQCQLDELQNCKRRNDKPGMATLYTNLGIVYYEKGDYEEALQCYEKGLNYSEELGNKQLTAIAIGCIGSVYQQQGDYATALENFLTDLKVCEEIGDKQGVAIALGLLGELRAVEGEFELAKDYLETALQLGKELNYQKGIAKAANNLGDIYTFLREYQLALRYYHQAIDIARRISNQLVLGFSLVEKSEVLVKMGKHDEAQKIQKEANAIAKKLGNPDLLFQSRLLTASLNHHFESPEKARKILLPLLAGELEDHQRADVYYELFLISPQIKDYRDTALDLYHQLYKDTPKYSFRERIELLSKD